MTNREFEALAQRAMRIVMFTVIVLFVINVGNIMDKWF